MLRGGPRGRSIQWEAGQLGDAGGRLTRRGAEAGKDKMSLNTFLYQKATKHSKNGKTLKFPHWPHVARFER